MKVKVTAVKKPETRMVRLWLKYQISDFIYVGAYGAALFVDDSDDMSLVYSRLEVWLLAAILNI